MAGENPPCVRTLRLKVKREGYAWLSAAAIEVNQVWNYANAMSFEALRRCTGRSRHLSAYDLDKLTAGATEFFERIGSDTIQRVNAEFATRRRQFEKRKLRWRKSFGSKRNAGHCGSQGKHSVYLSANYSRIASGSAAALPKMRSGTGGCACRWSDPYLLLPPDPSRSVSISD
jgi:hypothetical protein